MHKYKKDGPAKRVTQQIPRAHSMKQRDGSWKVYDGNYPDEKCLGQGASASLAWIDADRKLKERSWT